MGLRYDYNLNFLLKLICPLTKLSLMKLYLWQRGACPISPFRSFRTLDQSIILIIVLLLIWEFYIFSKGGYNNLRNLFLRLSVWIPINI